VPFDQPHDRLNSHSLCEQRVDGDYSSVLSVRPFIAHESRDWYGIAARCFNRFARELDHIPETTADSCDLQPPSNSEGSALASSELAPTLSTLFAVDILAVHEEEVSQAV
jgi:hypothetical protein